MMAEIGSKHEHQEAPQPLAGRGILVAGGSMGIGRSVARACLLAGADVTISGRSHRPLEEAHDELQKLAAPHQNVAAVPADVSSPDAVEKLIASAASAMKTFTGVVNCAAILGPIGGLDQVAIDQWVSTIHINLIGTMLLCRSTIPLFRERGYGKIVNFSGGGATSPRPRFDAYAASKAAVVRLTENLADELSGTGIDVNAVAPGAVNTRMLKEVLDAGVDRSGTKIHSQAQDQHAKGGTSPDRAAELCMLLLSAASDGLTGRLLSAVWDPWPSLANWKEKLTGTDLYTLRRIVPSDRHIALE